MRISLAAALSLAAIAAPAPAQLDPADCGTQDFPQHAATMGAPREPGPSLRLNEARQVVLYRGVRFASGVAAGERASRYSGLVGFTAERDGEYRIALAGPASIDVLRDGDPVAPVARRSGPTCSAIHRIFTYSLRRGEHVIQVGAEYDGITLLVYR